MPLLADAELVGRIQSGDEKAKGALFERYWRSVYLYCVRLLVDPDEANDAAQNAFIKGLDSLVSLDRPEAFRSWIFMIARNEVFTLLRRKRRNGTEPLENYKDALIDAQTPFDEVVSNERTEIIRNELLRLKPEFREVIVLREYEQLSYLEIAAVTVSTEGAVKARLFHARKAMLELLRPYFRERQES